MKAHFNDIHKDPINSHHTAPPPSRSICPWLRQRLIPVLTIGLFIVLANRSFADGTRFEGEDLDLSEVQVAHPANPWATTEALLKPELANEQNRNSALLISGMANGFVLASTKATNYDVDFKVAANVAKLLLKGVFRGDLSYDFQQASFQVEMANSLTQSLDLLFSHKAKGDSNQNSVTFDYKW